MYKVKKNGLPIYINGQCPIIKTCSDVTLNLSSKDSMYYNHSSMRKVNLVNGHVVYAYWIDTVYVQINLPTEFSKRTIFII